MRDNHLRTNLSTHDTHLPIYQPIYQYTVNQLLALMDGVARLPVPTFVIALTNRRELIDPAVLRPGRYPSVPPLACAFPPTARVHPRPGRLEVQVEVGRPDKDGRAAILGIHTERMRASGRLALGTPRDTGGGCTLEPPDDATYAQWIANLASQTSGFSGAALAALVRGAIARAIDRSVEALDTDGCTVTESDFVSAIGDLRATSLELEQLLTDNPGRRDAATLARGEEYVLMGNGEAECAETSTNPPGDVSLADEEPFKPRSDPAPDAVTMTSLSEQLESALQRIAALEDERRR